MYKYEEWLYHEQSKDSNSFSNILDEYSTKNIFNDYKHIKQENYTSMLTNKSCSDSLLNCIPLNRHKRDNIKHCDKDYSTKNIKEIIMQKMFDQIHLFIYHPLSNDKNNVHSRFDGEIS